MKSNTFHGSVGSGEEYRAEDAGGLEGSTGMDRLFAAISMIQGNPSRRPGQDAGFFAVESVMYSGMPSFLSSLNTDTGKVPPNLKFH